MKVKLYTDGGARGNPGPAAIGVIIKDENGKIMAAYGEYLGRRTNNYVEYAALISGLKKAKSLGADEVECALDSELVTKQINRQYKVKEPSLQKLFVQAYNAAAMFRKATFTHIPRDKNKEADKIVNQILDKVQK